MVALSSNMPTLLDIARRLDPNGSIGTIAEILQNYNDILEDIPWVEGNLPTGHQFNIRTSKPTPTFRLLNQGVVPAKSTTGQIVEGCAILEARNQIDKNVAELNGNTAAFRMSEDQAFIEGLSDTLSDTIIYGDISADPEQFNGLATRYYSLSGETTSSQVIDAGGTGSDNTSIWLVGWAMDKVFGIYPKGSKAGLQHEDLGLQDVITNTTTGATMRAYVSWYQWLCGIAIKDYRNVVRIANIDVSALATASDLSDSSANILKYMSKALDLLPPGGNYRPVFYMNNATRAMLRVKLLAKSNIYLSVNDVTGASGIARKELQFMGVPCRRIDSILSTESKLT